MKAEIWAALSELKKFAEIKALKLQGLIEAQEKQMEVFESAVSNAEENEEKATNRAELAEEEVEELKEKLNDSPFKEETMDDELKNKVLFRMRSNLSLDQIERLERQGRVLHLNENIGNYRD